MLNVEQVRLLEERVQRVISRTGELQRENGELRQHLEGYQERIKELEARLEEFVSNQAEIEQGVLNALHRLDEVEDAVVEGAQENRVVTVQPASPAPEDTAPSRDSDGDVNSTNNPPPQQSDVEAHADTPYETETALSNAPVENESEHQDVAWDDNDLPQTETEEESGPELDIF